MKYYVSSDIHGFFDEWVKALEEKGFDIKNPEHKIIVCGDLFDRGFQAKELQAFILELLKKDKVVLIKGNHDRSRSLYLDAGFQDVMNEFVLHPGQAGNKKTILFCHKPRIGIRGDVANIHGHIHEQTLDPTIFELENYFNVSVENINYTPIDLQEIIKRKGW